MNLEDFVFYQLKAEIALEDGNLQEAQVYASLADSSARASGPARGPASRIRFDRAAMKEHVRNGGYVVFDGALPPGPAPRI